MHYFLPSAFALFTQVDSDSDSELSVDEHSSSYASSHSSDSEDDDMDVKPKWNNERQPVHSTPKGTCVVLPGLNVMYDRSTFTHKYKWPLPLHAPASHGCMLLL